MVDLSLVGPLYDHPFPPVSDENFKIFHAVDRKLYEALINFLGCRAGESVRVCAFFQWLETDGKDPKIVNNLNQLSFKLLREMVVEALRCLECVNDNHFDENGYRELFYIPTFCNCRYTLRYFHANREIVIYGVRSFIYRVCRRAFEDIEQHQSFFTVTPDQVFESMRRNENPDVIGSSSGRMMMPIQNPSHHLPTDATFFESMHSGVVPIHQNPSHFPSGGAVPIHQNPSHFPGGADSFPSGGVVPIHQNPSLFSGGGAVAIHQNPSHHVPTDDTFFESMHSGLVPIHHDPSFLQFLQSQERKEETGSSSRVEPIHEPSRAGRLFIGSMPININEMGNRIEPAIGPSGDATLFGLPPPFPPNNQMQSFVGGSMNFAPSPLNAIDHAQQMQYFVGGPPGSGNGIYHMMPAPYENAQQMQYFVGGSMKLNAMAPPFSVNEMYRHPSAYEDLIAAQQMQMVAEIDMAELLKKNLTIHHVPEDTSLVHPDDRTVFLTFSKGYPTTETEVREFFTRKFGDDVEAIYMQEVSGDEQSLYARLVARTPAALEAIVEGGKAKYTINGKHVWARKFVKKLTPKNDYLPSEGQTSYSFSGPSPSN